MGPEHVTHGKPDPEIYNMTAAQAGVPSEKCLVFEDSPVGVTAAKAAGMRVVGVLTQHSRNELSAADDSIGDYTEIMLN